MINFFEIVLVLVIVGLGGWVYKLYQDKNESDREAKALAKEKDEYAELGQGLAEYNQKLQEKKEQAQQKIFDLIKSKGKISNKEAAKALGVSSATIRRYLDDLEAENKVKQVGKVGQQVFYKAI
ncbi:MAG: hypothetical protein A2998_01170 [Candidatus Staskawiczbacteria bacterium RIFCSPLOWO2_01_FULL_37_25b]|uniref:HTH deoR-type domain-containing protein n=2 Tax=Candidatus Staskawicziibacteriota TaxID=1817916 RepID=A0A1G2HS11_9BACT|nr:MAG: hypothetical protein A2812_02855 [Candidatus Staskawiczbacteria bacterium RIFCSPHIGHO2_01_FULL_36_16]OGZ72379.1 MAG: hypothetical protein A2998_01170 [Candidatus Staskawiczbacteria bacterium RIFCSPLOWO2_01_FULL_37_25b]